MSPVGGQPRARFAASLEITKPQAEVLALLTGSLQSAGAIGRQLGRSGAGVNASLYALADRGLVRRVPGKGWCLAGGAPKALGASA